MTRRIRPGGVELRVFKPDNQSDDPDLVVGGPDGDPTEIRQADVTRSLGAFKDQSKFAVDNRNGKYRRGTDTITAGDRVEWWVRLAADDTPHRRFTGIVRSPSVALDGAGASTLSFTAEEFVGFVLSNRVVEAGFKDRQVAGTPESILNWIVREKCPEIDTTGIGTIDARATMQFNAENVLKAVRKVIERGDVSLHADGRGLIVRPQADLAAPENVAFNLVNGDWGTGSWQGDDDDLANHVRIDGGTSRATVDTQTTQTGYQTVTKTSRIAHQLDVPKSEVTAVELWTDPTRTASGDGVVVRLQKNQDGAPINPEQENLDLARKTLAAEFLEHGGYTDFLLPDNDVLNDTPWLLIEADDSGDGSGQAIGVNMAGEPTYRAYYPYPISTRLQDPDSIDEYRRRESQTHDASLESLAAVGESAQAELRHRNRMSETFETDARTDRMHRLGPGEAVTLDLPDAGVAGAYTLTKRQDSFADGKLSTDVTLQDTETI